MALVMLVDHNDLVRDALEDALIEEGHEALAVTSGQQAILEYRTAKPDVVVTDILMPGMSGTAVIKKLRRESASVPILAISVGGGATNQNLLQQATDAGANATLTKPFAIGKFMGILSGLLDAG